MIDWVGRLPRQDDVSLDFTPLAEVTPQLKT